MVDTTPNCACWADSEKAEERETICQGFGVAIGEMLRANGQVWSFCDEAMPYLAGAALCGLAATVAVSRMTGDQVKVSFEEIEASFELVVAHGRARLRTAHLQHMDVKGSA